MKKLTLFLFLLMIYSCSKGGGGSGNSDNNSSNVTPSNGKASLSTIDSGNTIFILSTTRDNRDDSQKIIKIMKCDIPSQSGPSYLSTVQNCGLITTPTGLIYDPQDITIADNNLVYITGLNKDSTNKLFPAATICQIDNSSGQFQNCITQNLNNVKSYYSYSNVVVQNGFLYTKGGKGSPNILTICPINNQIANLDCITSKFDNDIANTSYLGVSDNKIFFSSFDGRPVSFEAIPDYKTFSQLTTLNLTEVSNLGGTRNYESGMVYFNKKYFQRHWGFILIVRPDAQIIPGIDRDFMVDEHNGIPLFGDNEFGHVKINKFNNTLYSIGNKYETTMSKKLAGCNLTWLDTLVKSPSEAETATNCKQTFYSNTVDTSIFNNTYNGEIDRIISIAIYNKN